MCCKCIQVVGAVSEAVNAVGAAANSESRGTVDAVMPLVGEVVSPDI